MDPQAQNTPPNTPETNQPNLEQNPSTEEYPQESPKRTSKMKKMGINILATIILLAFIMIALWIYKNKISKPSLVQPPPSPTQTETSEPSSKIKQQPETSDTYETITKPNPQDESLTDVYIKNLRTNDETFLITLADVYRQHIHNSEYHSGNLYIIKRIGYDGYPDEDWTDELWKYDTNKEGKKLLSSQGIFFLVSPNDTMIGAVANEKLVFIDTDGTQLKQYLPEELDANPDDDADMLNILEWSSDSKNLWGRFTFGPTPAGFFDVDTKTWEVKKYDISNLNFGPEGDLNTENKKVVYSDYPAMFDVQSLEDFEANGQKVTLYLYDFATQENKEIATSTAKRFTPKWLDNEKVEYNNPNGEGRLVYPL